jgi:hypothetical protein
VNPQSISCWIHYQLALMGGFLAMSAHIFLAFSRSAWFTPQHIGSTLAAGLLFGHVVALMVLVARDLPLWVRGKNWSRWLVLIISIAGGITLGTLSWWVHITLTLLQTNPDWLTLLGGGIGLSFGFWVIPIFADVHKGGTHYAPTRMVLIIVITTIATFLPIYFAYQNFHATFNTPLQAQALLYFQADNPEHVWLIGLSFALAIAIFGQLPMLFMTNSTPPVEP